MDNFVYFLLEKEERKKKKKDFSFSVLLTPTYGQEYIDVPER